MRWHAGIFAIVTPLSLGGMGSVQAQGPPLMPPPAIVGVSFDRHAVAEGVDRVLVDFGELSFGAFAQVMGASDHPGLRISRPQADSGVVLPEAPKPRGDDLGPAPLAQPAAGPALSLDRDSLISIADPGWASWLTAAERLRSLIIAGVWLLALFVLLVVLQGMARARPTAEKPVSGAQAPVRRDGRG